MECNDAQLKYLVSMQNTKIVFGIIKSYICQIIYNLY